MVFAHVLNKGPDKVNNQSYLMIDPELMIFLIASEFGKEHPEQNNARDAVKYAHKEFTSHYNSSNHNVDAIRKAFTEAFLLAHRRVSFLKATEKKTKGVELNDVNLDIGLVAYDRFYFGHVGENRIYHYSNGGFTQGTIDHVTDLGGGATTVDISVGMKGNMIGQLSRVKLTEKDFVLLCNRGFYKGVSDRYMKAVFYGLVGSVEDRLMHLKSTERNNGCKDDLCAILYKHGGK